MSMDKEKYFDAKSIKGKYQHAVAADTAKALTHFCEQEPEFEQAVEQSGKSFQECLDSVVKGIKQSCSDLEVYSRAVKFYMSIDLCGDNGYTAPPITVTKSSLSVSLDDLLDF